MSKPLAVAALSGAGLMAGLGLKSRPRIAQLLAAGAAAGGLALAFVA